METNGLQAVQDSNYTPGTIAPLGAGPTGIPQAGSDAQDLGSELSQGHWYHGSPTPGLTPEVLSVHNSNYGSLFGPGVYLTDNPEIADTYSSHKGKLGRSIESPKPTIYRAETQIGGAIDAEKPIDSSIRTSLLNSLGDGDPEGTIAKYAPEGTSFGNTYRVAIANLKQLYDNMHQADFPDRIQQFFGELKSAGYDAIRYDGGTRVTQLSATNGKPILHNAVNIIDPNGELLPNGLQKSNNILRFNPVGTLQDILHSLAQPMAGAVVPPFMSDAIEDYKRNQQKQAFSQTGS